MAVYTHIDEGAVERMLGICPDVGRLVALEGVAAGSINSVYKVTTDREVLYLRINEGKTMADLAYERDVLTRLRSKAQRRLGMVDIPELVRSSVGTVFFPVDDTRYAMLFRELEGRELELAEVTADHLRQVGQFLARAHLQLADLPTRRKNPYGQEVVTAWLVELREADAEGRLRIDTSALEELGEAFGALAEERAGSQLPTGVVHGDLFINNSKWRHDQLMSVFDWEMAGTDHLALDLAVVLNAWCFDGSFVPDHCRALCEGYQSVRPLEPAEEEGLFAETRFAALRFALSRVRDFEVAPREGDDRDLHRTPLDYRDFVERFRLLDRQGADGFLRLLSA